MKRFSLILTLLLTLSGLTIAQNNNPMHGWHTYCQSDFCNAIGYGIPTQVATCYPPDMASNFAGTEITKVAIYSDTLYNAVGGIYTCSIYEGGESPDEGILRSTDTVVVPYGLGDWAEFDLTTPVLVTGHLTLWVVWRSDPSYFGGYPMGVCDGSDPSGNGCWAWSGSQWEQVSYLTHGDWTVKTYFAWDGPQPQPQDVYFASNSNGVGKVWKNNTLIQSVTDTLLVDISSLQITSAGDIYTAGYSHDSLFDQTHGRIWLNDSIVFDAGTNTAIYELALNGNQWTAAGVGENEWENVAGLVWQDGEVLYAFSDSIASHQIKALVLDTITGDIYTGGCTAEPETRAVVWKNDTILWIEDSLSTINAIAFDGTNLYAAGSVAQGEQIMATLWRNDSIIFSISADNAEFNAIALYDSSVYLGGYNGNSLYIWQDNEVLYDHECTEYSNIFALTVNESGVYYAGQIDSIATVWKDGQVLYQPDSCEFINSLCVLPAPLPPVYNITLESNNTDWGTVSGGGSYSLGDTAIIFASPKVGCEFLGWNDSITESPRYVIVTQDSTFTATFARIPYTITVESSNPDWGSVSGGGTYYYGDTIQISATANPGFKFVRWSDGYTNNPRTVVVTGSQSFTAIFEIRQYHITTYTSPVGAGTVEGGGSYYYGDTVRLTATGSNNHYYFEKWNDGETANPRTIIVVSDTTLTAIFKPRQYTITTSCEPVEGGTVIGAGIYDYGSIATLTATPNENYTFLCWSDGIASNPRNVTVSGQAHYKALFHFNGLPQHTITVTSNDPLLGTVAGGGTYPEGSTIDIKAMPNANAVFTSWDDGNTDNPRSIVVTQDMEFKAIFTEVELFTITVRAENPLLGTTYGGGIYPANQVISIGATPTNGFHFSGWQDGNMNNPRTIVVTNDAEYIASFSQNPVQTYTVTVLYDENQGFILGAGNYNAGATASLAAIPADGYVFQKWSDETIDNPKTVLVDHNIVLTAYFEIIGVDENGFNPISLYPNPASDKIRFEGLEGRHEIKIFNSFGMLIKTASIDGSDEINIEDLPDGLYVIPIGSRAFRLVKKTYR